LYQQFFENKESRVMGISFQKPRNWLPDF